MSSYYKTNIEKIKKALTIASAVFVFIITFVILTNVYISIYNPETSHEKKFLKHLISDHSINDINFEFIKINLNPLLHFENKSDLARSPSIEFGIFSLLSMIVLYYPKRDKISYAEIFLFIAGFKSSLFRPPKY